MFGKEGTWRTLFSSRERHYLFLEGALKSIPAICTLHFAKNCLRHVQESVEI